MPEAVIAALICSEIVYKSAPDWRTRSSAKGAERERVAS